MRTIKELQQGGEREKKGAVDKRRGEMWGWEKKTQHIKNSKHKLTIQHRTQNINKHLLASHIKTQKQLEGVGWG